MSEFVGYFQSGKPPKITDGYGNVISDEVKIISSKKLPLSSYVSDRLLYIRFRYKGKIWPGTTPGGGMYVKARPTKLKELWVCQDQDIKSFIQENQSVSRGRKVEIQDIRYYGYHRGFKVWINGVKYPIARGEWYTTNNQQTAINQAFEEAGI